MHIWSSKLLSFNQDRTQKYNKTARFDFRDKGVLNMNNVCSVGWKIDDSIYLEAVYLQC